MKISYTPKFRDSFKKFSRPIQNKFRKQASFLLSGLRHPSLKSKKYDEAKGIWQGRVDRKVRFYFLIEKDHYILLDIIQHP